MPGWSWALTTALILGLPLACRESGTPSETAPEEAPRGENPILRVPDPEIRAQLLSEDPDTRVEGLVMMEVDRDLALNVLEYIWDHDPHPQVREFLVDEVAEEGGERAAKMLVRFAGEARDAYVRDNVLFLLTRPGFIEYVPVEPMKAIVYRNELHSDFRSGAMEVLRKGGTPEGIAALKEFAAQHPQADIRFMAVIMLRSLEDPELIPFFQELLETEEDRDVQAALKGSINRLGPEGEEEAKTS
jgi:HEAT repeat protein